MTTPTTQTKAHQSNQKGNWIPYLFLLAFAVVFTANGIMIATAMDSFPGFSSEYQQVKSLTAESQTSD